MNRSTPGFLVHHQLTPRAYSNSCPSIRWCCPTISSSVISFSSWLQSFPASGSFPMSQLSTSGGQSIGVSALASVLPMNILDWLPLQLTSLISLQFMGLSRVFNTVQKHQFFSAQLSSQSNSHLHTWPLEKTIALTRWTFIGKVICLLLNMLSNKTRSWLWLRSWTPYCQFRLKLKKVGKTTRLFRYDLIKSLMIIQWKWERDLRA